MYPTYTWVYLDDCLMKELISAGDKNYIKAGLIIAGVHVELLGIDEQ